MAGRLVTLESDNKCVAIFQWMCDATVVCRVYIQHTTVYTWYRRENQVKCVCAGPANAPIHAAGGHFCALLYVHSKKIQSLSRFFFCLFISNHFFFFWKNKENPCVCVCVCVCVWRKDGELGGTKRPSRSVYLFNCSIRPFIISGRGSLRRGTCVTIIIILQHAFLADLFPFFFLRKIK